MVRLSDHRRRAFGVMCWIALFYCAAQVGGGLALDYLWPQVRFPSAYRKLATLRAWPRSPDILFLGSSRTGTDCRQELISQQLQERCPGEPLLAYNASLTAGDFVSNDFLLDLFLKNGVRPKVAVVEVTPEMVCRCNTWLQMHVSRQLRWDDVPHYFTDVCRAGQLGRLCMARLEPLYVHRQEILDDFSRSLLREGNDLEPEGVPVLPSASKTGPDSTRSERVIGVLTSRRSAPKQTEIDWQTVIAKSVGGIDVSQVERTEIGLYGPRRVLRPGYAIGGTATECFERILSNCRAHEITTLLLEVPVCSRYRALYTPEIDGIFRAYIKQVTEKYGCRFVACRNWVPDLLFYDNHHLTIDGGVYFSQRFTAEVLEPMFEREP